MLRFLRLFIETAVKMLLLFLGLTCVHLIGIFGYAFGGFVGLLIGYFLGITLFASALIYYSENL
jgi:hypothetical protein